MTSTDYSTLIGGPEQREIRIEPYNPNWPAQRTLSLQRWNDVNDYAEAKASVIEAILAAAIGERSPYRV